MEKPIEILIDELFDGNLHPTRKIMEQVWYRNILYYIGEQYIEYSKSLRGFRRMMHDEYTPTPVANIIQDYVRSMKAMVLNKDYGIRVFPNSNDIDDEYGAKLGVEILQDMDDAGDKAFDDEKDKVTTWMVILGVGMMRTYPDMGAGEWFVDKNGEYNTTGDVACENWNLFNVLWDEMNTKLKKKRWVGSKTMRTVEWVEDTFHIKVTPDGNDQEMIYQNKLMKMVASVSPWKGARVDTSSFVSNNDDMCIFKEVEFAPTKKFPEGRYVAKAGGVMCFDTKRLPIQTDGKRWDYTWTDFHYLHVPGRFESEAGVNSQISHQDSINQIDQDLEKNRHGLGQPTIAGPEPNAIKRVSNKGQGYIYFVVDPLLSGGVMPKISHGVPLPNQVLEARAIHKQSSQEAAGNPRDILGGQTPNSQASGVLVDILREAAEQGHVPDIARYYRSLQRVYRKRLVLAKELFTEQRMLKIAGRGKEIQVKYFTGADLRNNTDVRLELDNKAAVTEVGQLQSFTELAKSGVIPPEVLQDPYILRTVLGKFGLDKYNEKTDVDTARAEKENAIMFAAEEKDGLMVEKEQTENGEVQRFYIEGIFLTEIPPDIQAAIIEGEILSEEAENYAEVISKDDLFKYDHHAAHYEAHRRKILSDEFQDLNPLVQQIAIRHADIHHHEVEMQRQQEMQQQMEMQNMGEPAQ